MASRKGIRKRKKLMFYDAPTPPPTPISNDSPNLSVGALSAACKIFPPRISRNSKKKRKRNSKKRKLTNFDILCQRLCDNKKQPVLPMISDLSVNSPKSNYVEPSNTPRGFEELLFDGSPTVNGTNGTNQSIKSLHDTIHSPQSNQSQSQSQLQQSSDTKGYDGYYDDNSLSFCMTLYPLDGETIKYGIHYTHQELEKTETKTCTITEYTENTESEYTETDEQDEYIATNKHFDDNTTTPASTSDPTTSNYSYKAVQIGALFNSAKLPKIDYLYDNDNMSLPSIPKAKAITPLTPLTPDTADTELTGFDLDNSHFPDVIQFSTRGSSARRRAPPKLRFNQFTKRNSVLSGTNWD